MDEDLSELLFNAINEQGYLFQEKCKEILTRAENGTGWAVRADDYPVSVGDEETRIDIVLRGHGKTPEKFGIIECKRVNPSYVSWCFGSPGPRSMSSFRGTYLSRADLTGKVGVHGTEIARGVTERPFKLDTCLAESWWEARKGPSRSNRVSASENMERAFVQVMKGVAGFAREQRSQRSKIVSGFEAFLCQSSSQQLHCSSRNTSPEM